MTKPRFILFRGKGITAENVAEMHFQITGEKLTPEQIEEGRAIFSGRASKTRKAS